MIENPLIRTGPDQFSWAAKDQANQSRADNKKGDWESEQGEK